MTLNVFLVEDNKTIRDNLIPTIEEMVQASVTHYVESEADARTWLQSHDDWQLAVVDLFLNEGSGMGVLRTMRSRRSFQKVAVLSNYATAEIRQQCTSLGADRVFDKSTELDAFLEYCSERASAAN